MIIDSHVHLFQKRVQTQREKFFDAEPEFRLLYSSPKARIAGTEDLVGAMDKHGVAISVASGFPWRTPDLARENNDYIIDAHLKHPDRILGLACFDALWEGAAKEAERCIDAGLSGAGELAFYLSGIDDAALRHLEPVMALLRQKGNKPCLIHTNEPVGHTYPGKTPVTPGQIYSVAKAFPENRIVLAHWGGGIFFYNIMKKEVKETFANIWFDTAASPFLYDPAVYDIAAETGLVDKVLFGTDFPLLGPGIYYRDIKKTSLSPDQKEKIMGKNAAALWL